MYCFVKSMLSICIGVLFLQGIPPKNSITVTLFLKPLCQGSQVCPNVIRIDEVIKMLSSVYVVHHHIRTEGWSSSVPIIIEFRVQVFGPID